MRLIKSMTDQDMTVTVHELEGDVEQRPNKDIIKDYCERREGKLYT